MRVRIRCFRIHSRNAPGTRQPGSPSHHGPRWARWTANGLIAAGLILVGCSSAFYLLETRIFQAREMRKLEETLKLPAPLKPRCKLPAEGEVLGRIDVPRIRLSSVIVEGDDPVCLRLGVGHLPDTALPGTSGNVALAAHRDTFFRPLEKVRRNDQILVTTPYGCYRYVVTGTEIVPPSDVAVLNPGRRPQLTLITCYPFHFFGSAPKRFVVHAYLEG